MLIAPSKKRLGGWPMSMRRQILGGALLLAGCADFVDASTPAGTTTVAGDGSSASSDSGPTTQGVATSGLTADASGVTTEEPSTGDGPPNETVGQPGSTGEDDEPVCGDGMVDEGEACDDANNDDGDGCTANCELSSCRDGRRNGTETDVDCGGACAATCDPGEECAVETDCTQGVCGPDGLCAAPACDDGVRNGDEVSADCGPVCGTPPVNVIVNGDFESGTDDWVVENPEINPQTAYFADGSQNRVVEIDRNGDTTSRWQQGFQVPDHQVGVTLALRLAVGDRVGHGGDVGGLLLRISGPDGSPLPLTGMAGPNFVDNGSSELGIDATSVGSFQTAVVHFEPTAAGGHVLALVEQVSGGQGLNNGSGLVLDDVEVLLVDCGGG